MNRRGFLASLCAWLWALVFGKVPEVAESEEVSPYLRVSMHAIDELSPAIEAARIRIAEAATSKPTWLMIDGTMYRVPDGPTTADPWADLERIRLPRVGEGVWR